MKYKQALEEVDIVLKTVKYDDKKDDSDDSDFSGDDVKEPPSATPANIGAVERMLMSNAEKATDPKRSLEGRQHNSLPHNDPNKIIIKKKLPLTLPTKKKK